MAKNNINKNNGMENNLSELNKDLNKTIKKVMEKKTSSTIAKTLGKSVSTITRIRNGEIKRGIDPEFLRDIWKACEGTNNVDLDALLDLNRKVSDAHYQKENEKWDQDSKEITALEEQIQKIVVNSGAFIRKVNKPYIVIPEVELYPEMSFETISENGEKKSALFYTRFYSQRRIAQKEERRKEDPEFYRTYPSHLKTILEFRELRALHKEYENCELVIIFNYEAEYSDNCDILKKLSNKDNITLALMDSSTKKIVKECCLDGRKKGILTELGLVKSEKRDTE